MKNNQFKSGEKKVQNSSGQTKNLDKKLKPNIEFNDKNEKTVRGTE